MRVKEAQTEPPSRTRGYTISFVGIILNIAGLFLKKFPAATGGGASPASGGAGRTRLLGEPAVARCALTLEGGEAGGKRVLKKAGDG